MDAAALAALRLAIEVALADARRDLARCHDELQEADTAAERTARAQEALQADLARWKVGLRSLTGHSLSGLELRNHRGRGEAIEARLLDAARCHHRARADVARAQRRWDEQRRSVGEQLARQRWIEEETRRGREVRERQATQREDED